METIIKAKLKVPGTEIHKGPSLGVVATITIVLFTLNVAAYQVLTNWTNHPIPTGSPEAAQDYFQRYPWALRISAFLQIGAAITIGIFTATIASQLRFLEVKAVGINIAMFDCHAWFFVSRYIGPMSFRRLNAKVVMLAGGSRF